MQRTRGRPNDEMLGWEAAGLHCSANERRADEASRDVEAWLKCKYMRGRLGEEFSGTVTAVTSFGLFVTLDALYVEGLVHITELGGEYFRYDERRQELRGERTGVRYGLGSKVMVQVSRVDLDGRRIDFRLVPPADAAEAALAGRERSAANPDAAAGARSQARRVPAAKDARRTGRASSAPASAGKPADRSRRAGQGSAAPAAGRVRRPHAGR
jgi:ribonuclease R